MNVLEHPEFRIPLNHGANAYQLSSEEDPVGLFGMAWGNGVASRYFEPLESVEALSRRMQIIEEHTRLGRATLNLTKAVGTDALAGLRAVAHDLAAAGHPQYQGRVAEYHDWCAIQDVSIGMAQTDVKGDRSLRPSEQEDPDLHVRIVERRDDGIVVRGAKAHTTMGPLVDELIVLPTRSMSLADADYAVAFATPADADGIHMICGPLPNPDASVFDRPVSSRNVEMETLTVFDNVFVPWERVFLAGEHEFAGPLALAFATFHRFTAISYKLPMADLLLGLAVEISEHNGTASFPHVRDKLAQIVLYGQLLRACVLAAVEQAQSLECGLMMPNPAFTSAGKYHFSNSYHGIVQILQDLAGGFAITAPWEKDLMSEATGPFVRKYMAGAVGTDVQRRLQLFQAIRDITASDFAGYNEVVTLHGEGSLRAQLLQLLSSADLERGRAAVEYVLESGG